MFNFLWKSFILSQRWTILTSVEFSKASVPNSPMYSMVGCAGLSERAVDQSGNDGLPVPHLLPCPPPRLPGHCRQGMGRGSKNPSYFSFSLHSPQSFSWTLASHYGKFNAEILSSWYLGGCDILFVGSSFLMSRYSSNLRDTVRYSKLVRYRYRKLLRNLFFVTGALRLWLKRIACESLLIVMFF